MYVQSLKGFWGREKRLFLDLCCCNFVLILLEVIKHLILEYLKVA